MQRWGLSESDRAVHVSAVFARFSAGQWGERPVQPVQCGEGPAGVGPDGVQNVRGRPISVWAERDGMRELPHRKLQRVERQPMGCNRTAAQLQPVLPGDVRFQNRAERLPAMRRG